jgi:hypothetical protein
VTDSEDPLVRRDSAGNLALLVQFSGDFTAWEAAQYFASMATPEPRRACEPAGGWIAGHGQWSFRLVGGHRTYLMTYDGKYGSWRVYMLPMRIKRKKEVTR